MDSSDEDIIGLAAHFEDSKRKRAEVDLRALEERSRIATERDAHLRARMLEPVASSVASSSSTRVPVAICANAAPSQQVAPPPSTVAPPPLVARPTPRTLTNAITMPQASRDAIVEARSQRVMKFVDPIAARKEREALEDREARARMEQLPLSKGAS